MRTPTPFSSPRGKVRRSDPRGPLWDSCLCGKMARMLKSPVSMPKEGCFPQSTGATGAILEGPSHLTTHAPPHLCVHPAGPSSALPSVHPWHSSPCPGPWHIKDHRPGKSPICPLYLLRMQRFSWAPALYCVDVPTQPANLASLPSP